MALSCRTRKTSTKIRGGTAVGELEKVIRSGNKSELTISIFLAAAAVFSPKSAQVSSEFNVTV